MVLGAELETIPVSVNGVDLVEIDVIRQLITTWRQKRGRNRLRSAYYGGTNSLRQLGIAIPPELMHLKATLGWPAKAVRALVQRMIFDGFVAPGADEDPFGLSDVLEANRFDIELPQALNSMAQHCFAMVTMALGDVQSGEPEVMVLPRSAEYSSALWDKRRRRVSAALTIADTDDQDRPTAVVAYLPDSVLTVEKTPSGRWVADRRPNPLGYPLVEVLPYDPLLDRPFGRSRITRAVMDITDRAARSVIRAEVGAEFYSVPQRWIMGANESAFSNPDGSPKGQWKALQDRWLALSKDEDGDVPSVGQFSQMTMEPHLAQFRQYAAQFAGETGVPLNSLGVVQDNPSSAEAIYAAKEDLIVEAGDATRVVGGNLRRMAQTIVLLRDKLTEPTPALRKIKDRWRNPAFPSAVSAGDALVKMAAVFPWLGQSDVALERAGFTESEITRLAAVRDGGDDAIEEGPGEEFKVKADATAALIRSGFKPDAAVRAAGLAPIDHLGLLPVTVQRPENVAPDAITDDPAAPDEQTPAPALPPAAGQDRPGAGVIPQEGTQ